MFAQMIIFSILFSLFILMGFHGIWTSRNDDF